MSDNELGIQLIPCSCYIIYYTFLKYMTKI